MHTARRARVGAGLRAWFSTGLAAAPFEEAFVAAAPATSRVYFLYRHHRVIYIGVVSREYLRAHMAQHRGRAPSCNELEG